MPEYHGQQVVHAAQQGDQQALDELIASYLPLIYNIVGRALQGHADVDDVVQETMLKVVNGLSGLRDPAAFRSWTVSIAIREVRNSRRREPLANSGGLELLQGIADPGADFVDLTILQLGLTGQRRETVEATRWLDEADRDLLALWWLEAAGQITRGELADALELSPAYAAVRVQRMKAQLEIARAVVRAVWAAPRCARLDEEIRVWDGRPSQLWRKRLARHIRECSECSAYQRHLVPAEALLAGIGLVLPPVTGVYLASRVWSPSPQSRPTGGNSSLGAPAKQKRHRSHPRRSRLLSSKPVIASVVLATLSAGGAIALTDHQSAVSVTSQAADTSGSAVTPSSNTPTTAPSPSASPSASLSATPSLGTRAASATRTSPGPSLAVVVASPVYGQTVDTADAAPGPDSKPGPLPQRPETVPITATGDYSQPFKGSLGGKYLMFYRGQYVTITGEGYFRVRYEIAWFNRVGLMVMPTWTGLQGKLFHVASGGGHLMSDTPSGQPAGYTWMGNPKAGYITLPPGAQQMWSNEYFYLDGTVTLHENEGYADYNLSVTPVTWADVTEDIDTAPGKNAIRYGLVRDTGTDAAPVPQYLTRSTPAQPTNVPQHSEVAPPLG